MVYGGKVKEGQNGRIAPRILGIRSFSFTGENRKKGYRYWNKRRECLHRPGCARRDLVGTWPVGGGGRKEKKRETKRQEGGS